MSIIDESFDIEPYAQTELIDVEESRNLPSVNIVHEDYDAKDVEIEDQFQDVYDKAMEAFEVHVEEAKDIEGKYLARNSEVANQLLSTALNAAKEKANLKQHSDNLKVKKSQGSGSGTGTTNITNNVIMDRNELLRMMKGS